MKHIKYSIGLAVIMAALLAVPAGAQNHRSQSFLAVQSVYATNTLNITNLMTTGSVGTNKVGTRYTNQNALVTAATGLSTTRNLLQDVSLWALRDGSGPWSAPVTTNQTLNHNYSYATVSATLTAGSGAEDAITFVITPLFNGRDEATAAGEQWTFSFTPTASTKHTFVTNAPLWRWPGADALRLR